MKLYTLDEDPIASPIHTWRHSPWGNVVGLLLMLGLAAGLGIAIITQDLPGFVWIFAGLFLLIALMVAGSVVAAFSRQNWLMKFDGSQIALKFRSYLNRHFKTDNPVIAVFDPREIASARKTTQRWTTPTGNRSGSETRTMTFLDLRLNDPAAVQELKAALDRERRPPRVKEGGAKTQYHHMPVRVIEPDLVRVTWSGPRDQIRPKIDDALRRLESAVTIEEEHRAPDLDWNEIPEDRLPELVRELSESGRRMDAIKVVRLRTGLDLKASKQYVDSLESGDAATGAAAETAPTR